MRGTEAADTEVADTEAADTDEMPAGRLSDAEGKTA